MPDDVMLQKTNTARYQQQDGAGTHIGCAAVHLHVVTVSRPVMFLKDCSVKTAARTRGMHSVYTDFSPLVYLSPGLYRSTARQAETQR